MSRARATCQEPLSKGGGQACNETALASIKGSWPRSSSAMSRARATCQEPLSKGGGQACNETALASIKGFLAAIELRHVTGSSNLGLPILHTQQPGAGDGRGRQVAGRKTHPQAEHPTACGVRTAGGVRIEVRPPSENIRGCLEAEQICHRKAHAIATNDEADQDDGRSGDALQHRERQVEKRHHEVRQANQKRQLSGQPPHFMVLGEEHPDPILEDRESHHHEEAPRKHGPKHEDNKSLHLRHVTRDNVVSNASARAVSTTHHDCREE
eukprot:CAMPEP_0177482488 /NCGR_PEP_ID=MMETSP0369-20130122/26953_1 /TAXON_ID=447022 ORGANISM="Scrippsiella hangoei-like, Strain SHHI-4" /NCGR_SAMPLE_ID=MMETSP0369 /ASSEMBLY_ACC=CAM_ASM_000364 /LENGTH=268 /DNA_ID=CAMNT_0018958401 /DNA_START=30 /DNA_END=835 /DNA_ORIENTATION=+